MTTDIENNRERFYAFTIPVATAILSILIAILLNWCNGLYS
jgi:hypothetical protein